MTEIICPYDGDCGRHFAPSAMDAPDGAFLTTAIAKKMTFMFLHCPACARMFQFNPVAWTAQACETAAPKAAKVAKKNGKQLEKLLAREQVIVPQAYLAHLRSAKSLPGVAIFKDEEPFTLYSLDALCQDVDVDGTRYLAVRQLAGFGQALAQAAGTGSKQAAPFSLAELADCLAIGEENTRILFIDSRDNEALWIYHCDGGDVEPTQLTLTSLIGPGIC
ncbi:hypothetical protein [Janthinobacterium sp. SUN137]|uniref:hypothetical protein n=1 Tax=Janthinobacterium sp. SUN137 TaxID=3014789 RepID=UPI0027142B44|nr:hypothetical protein [Janthinobacterium sp. SUN137]MDO8039013.1 hypothetical protein [Janthinobacterium sp. SUN137]